jgi:quinol monooxygenase YgiN
MPVTVTLDVLIQPAKLDEFLATLKELLPATRAYDGCQSLQTYADQDDPNHIVLIEQWESRAKQERYIAWRTETGVMAALGGFVAEPPRFTFLDARPDI